MEYEINELTFWWSVISTTIGLILAGVSIWQFFEAKSARDKAKAQVKVWMQEANGIQHALQRVVSDNLNARYSTTNDIANSIWALQTTAFSLYQSLYEERCVSEEEYKEAQKKLKEQFDTERQEQKTA